MSASESTIEDRCSFISLPLSSIEMKNTTSANTQINGFRFSQFPKLAFGKLQSPGKQESANRAAMILAILSSFLDKAAILAAMHEFHLTRMTARCYYSPVS
jgi:hypothetical protein